MVVVTRQWSNSNARTAGVRHRLGIAMEGEGVVEALRGTADGPDRAPSTTRSDSE